LHLFPLHALPLNSLENYLLDYFPDGVQYAPSCQLLQLSQKVAQQQNSSLHRLFAIQNPTKDLDFTDIEVEAIKDNFNPREIISQDKASKNAFDLAANSDTLRLAECVHFSCHGYFHAPAPLSSYLTLADSLVPSDLPANRNPGEATRYLAWRDNKDVDLQKCLTLGEIFALNLQQCRLVTLSACETGLTDWRQLTDEYIGLASGFLIAGSPSIVSSLWLVNDLSTCLLMIKFYQNLQTGLSIAKALNNAQCWLRDVEKEELQRWTQELPLSPGKRLSLEGCLSTANNKPFHSPEHWAAFCMIGQS
jgi:CHAT domain-containing protein